MDKPELNWKDSPELDRWLGTRKKSYIGQSAKNWRHFKAYVEQELDRTFTDAELAKYLIDEIEADQKKKARKKGEPQRQIIRFYKDLRNRGYAKSSSKNAVGSIMAFYRENGFKITFTKRFSDLFPSGGKPENKKQLLKPEDVRKLVEHAKSLRDKAMILVMYEGGMDDKTLCEMNVGDVLEVTLEAMKTEYITVNLYREKIEWAFFTHFGPNAVEAIRRYLRERSAILRKRDPPETLKDRDPLFVKEWTKAGNPKRIRPRNIQEVIRDVAVRAELLNPAILEKGQQAPIRPYALRGSFSTLLENDNCPEQFKEFWQGHKIKYMGAYFIPTEELSLKTYVEHYKALSIEEVTATASKLEQRVRDQEVLITTMMTRLSRMERFMKKYVGKAQREMEEYEDYVELRAMENEEPRILQVTPIKPQKVRRDEK